MKEIYKKKWEYTFSEKNGSYFLNVLCGGSALYEINIKLNESELEEYFKSGLIYIENKAKEIQLSPSKYQARNISNIEN